MLNLEQNVHFELQYFSSINHTPIVTIAGCYFFFSRNCLILSLINHASSFQNNITREQQFLCYLRMT